MHMQDNNNDSLNPWSNYALIVLKADFANPMHRIQSCPPLYKERKGGDKSLIEKNPTKDEIYLH